MRKKAYIAFIKYVIFIASISYILFIQHILFILYITYILHILYILLVIVVAYIAHIAYILHYIYVKLKYIKAADMDLQFNIESSYSFSNKIQLLHPKLNSY